MPRATRGAQERLAERKARTRNDRVHALQERRVEGAERAQLGRAESLPRAEARARVSAARSRAPPSRRASAPTESPVSPRPRHEHALACQRRVWRGLRQELEWRGSRIIASFSVDSPNSTSIIVMIQKRTTTWFSFQPFNS